MNYENIAVTVSDLNSYIKDKISQDEALNAVIVKGEISNFKHHYTGHLYFTLKDEKSLIKCIMFKTYADRLDFKPEDGMKVFLFGSVSVFERDGIYQIYAKSIKQDGFGILYEKYEKLKRDLEKEGLFDETHKKKIPLMPKIIGVLSSSTGAVIRDIINVSTRRNPNVYIRLFPVPVQGTGAAEEIANAIKFMNVNKLADVLILARGGGSLEDLWPFNEEVVARAIYNSDIPIISAVGHETDFTIADFVADLRAPTPSAAAELANLDIKEVKNKISNYKRRYKVALEKKLELMNLQYEKILNLRAFKDPYRTIMDNYLLIDNYMKSIVNSINMRQKTARLEFVEKVGRLDTLSPLKTLTRGYCLTEKEGQIINSSKKLQKDEECDLRFFDGSRKIKILN